jgi:hypothetical protein
LIRRTARITPSTPMAQIVVSDSAAPADCVASRSGRWLQG